MKLFRKQDRSGIRRPPENRLIVVVPGEDAMPVRFEQSLRMKVSANGKQPVRGGLINWWETNIVVV